RPGLRRGRRGIPRARAGRGTGRVFGSPPDRNLARPDGDGHDVRMRIGAYEVLAEIGRGGIGVVHKARAPDGNVIAVKVLHDVEPEALARFDRERRLLASLGEGEGFVGLLDAGSSAEGPYVVMPFMSGGTLRDRMKAPLPIEEAVSLA